MLTKVFTIVVCGGLMLIFAAVAIVIAVTLLKIAWDILRWY